MNINVIRFMLKGGASDEQIVRELSLGNDELLECYSKHPELLESRRALDQSFSSIEKILAKCAEGYVIEDSEVIASKDGRPLRVRKTKRNVPASLEACKMLMRYRSGDW